MQSGRTNAPTFRLKRWGSSRNGQWLPSSKSKKCEPGYAGGQFNLGVLYNEGTGVPENDAKAVKWYRKAAEQGLIEAQYNLGVTYIKGAGVPQEFVKAYMWWSLAKAQGYKDAACGLDQIKLFMTPAQIAKAQALATEWREKHN